MTPSSVFFGLRSNARSLLTGGGVESVRRRLKLCSLAYDHVFIEGGALSIQAGPSGSAVMPRSGAPDAWQTPRERGLEQASSFAVSFGVEDTPGAPASGPYHQLIDSRTSVSWRPTFEPFLAEFPAGADWLQLVRVEPSSGAEDLASRWSRTDERSPLLERQLHERFVRKLVIGHANTDLSRAVTGGASLSTDELDRVPCGGVGR